MADQTNEKKQIGGEFGEVIMKLLAKEQELDAEIDAIKMALGERNATKKKLQKQIKELSELNGTPEPTEPPAQ
ncbi:hypothetical protein D3C81_375430 [compost metagenome]